VEDRTRLENVRELLTSIRGYLDNAGEGEASLAGFLDEIALYTDLDGHDPDQDCVVMMTMHSAKGLEFPVVFVVGAEEGIFPGIRAIGETEEMEEERRLCYVAMTRAKEKLTLTNCRQRMLYGRTSANKASRFLEEIPEDNMHWESKPEPRFGGMEHDSTFGGDRYEGNFGGGSSYSSTQRTARTGSYTTGGSRENGSVHHYQGTAQAPQRPLASTRRGGGVPATVMQLEKGDMVEHTAFGKGMVLSVRPMGGDALAEVAFDKMGTKKLMLKSAGAHMKKL
jgi:DNA helicase-2/ATP-dependent DNA helicase PcrA